MIAGSWKPVVAYGEAETGADRRRAGPWFFQLEDNKVLIGH